MKNIYDIYESLLGNIENSMNTGEETMANYINTPEESIINIITLAGKLTVKETVILRSLISQIQREGGEDLISHFPTKLRDMLIVTSKRKLKTKDFKNFGSSVEAYGRYCNTVYNLLQSSCDITSIKAAINETPGKLINDSRGVQAIKLGNAMIFIYKHYMYIKINDIHRIIIEAKDLLGF
jgi:hypothetical protein